MEKMCEFCTALRPIVYCKADAAHLCLSCDARVHSANELSSRHLRTLLCELCKYRPAYARCLDHRVFMCRCCDPSLHGVSSQHNNRLIRSYVGCPSPKDFASLWGFDLNGLDNSDFQDQSLSTSCGSVDQGSVNSDIEGPSFGSEIYYKGQHQQGTSMILQQILDLRRLQLTEQSDNSSLLCVQEQVDISLSKDNTSRKPEDVNQFSQHFDGIGHDLQKMDSPRHDFEVEHFPFPLSQLDHFPSSSSTGIPLHGDSFWQCKSQVQNSQLWSQTMQDLGVCEEVSCFDDVNIPEVDLTFRNFEDLFGGDQDPTRPMLDSKDMTCSLMDKSDCLDSGVSPIIARGEPSCNSTVESNTHMEAGANAKARYKEKKVVRMYEKQTGHVSPKIRTGIQKRVKGQYVDAEDHRTNSLDVTRSY